MYLYNRHPIIERITRECSVCTYVLPACIAVNVNIGSVCSCANGRHIILSGHLNLVLLFRDKHYCYLPRPTGKNNVSFRSNAKLPLLPCLFWWRLDSKLCTIAIYIYVAIYIVHNYIYIYIYLYRSPTVIISQWNFLHNFISKANERQSSIARRGCWAFRIGKQ